jgi:acetylornithine/succinyldiaminopimelate/putrescine aminotransferase
MFAHQKYGITPDILLIAKGMGGGMPIGGVVASTDLMMHFASNPALGHITTFGGHPVCVAAALATIKLLLHESHIAEIAKKEVLLKSLLKHDMIKEVRSSGLMMAVEIRDPSLLTPLIDRVISDGVLIDYFLFNASSFRIAPPLIITDQEIGHGVRTILNAMDAILR